MNTKKIICFAKEATEQISIKIPVYTSDPLGAKPITDYTIINNIWAIIRPTKYSELKLLEQLQTKQTLEIIIYYQDILDNFPEANKYIINWNNIDFNILEISSLAHNLKNTGRIYQKIICASGTNS